jgi:hypothetical protein
MLDTIATRAKPHRLYRLDSSGHGLSVKWNPDNEREVKAARETFQDYQRKGYALFRMTEDEEQGERMREFDPDAPGILAVPQMQGG